MPKYYVTPFKKIITILWAIWNHKNIVIFNNHNCNPVEVIDQAHNTYHLYGIV